MNKYRKVGRFIKYSKNREELVETLSKYISNITQDDKKIDEIVNHLENKHNINLGRVMYFLNDPKRLNEAELPEIALLAEQVGLKLEEAEELHLQNWFNINEIKEIRQYYHVDESQKDKIELPITFENVTFLGDGVYAVALDYSIIARMYKWDLLNYNFEIQREGRLKKVGNNVIQEVKIYKKNVKEIKERVLKGIQQKTSLAYNCAVETSEDESEQELIFDEKNHTLTITKGTRIDILDGTHRTIGIYQAYLEQPEIEGKMIVLFSNYSTQQAREYQVELSKATPFNKARAKELAQERHADELVSRLKSEGMLKGRISSTNTINKSLNQLTTSSILSDAFDKHWKPEKRSDISKIIRKFNSYLDFLFEYFEDYIEDKNNLLFTKLFFIGHVILAKRMYDKDIPYEELNKYIEDISFNKNDDIWRKLNIVHDIDRELITDKKTIKGIEDFFKGIKLK